MYSFKDINNFFYREIIDDLKSKFQKLIDEKVSLYKEKINNKPESKKTYEFPLEKDLEILYDFVKGEIEDIDRVEKSLTKICNVIWQNPFTDDFVKNDIQWKLWRKNRLGFLCYYVKSKIKLYRKKDLQAQEVAVIVGTTSQYISQKINDNKKDPTLKGEKRGRSWVIENESVWNYIEKKQLTIYKKI